MKTRIKNGVLIFAISLILVATAQASSISNWTWTSGARIDEQGNPLAAAVAYEIFMTAGVGAEELVATVAGDTVWQHVDEPGVTYTLRVCGIDALGRRSPMSEASVAYTPPLLSAVPEVETAAVGPAVPNPFNPRTAISYVVPADVAGPVGLVIYDLRGRLVRRLPTSNEPGRHEAVWDGRGDGGRSLAAGTYVALYRAGSFSSTVKMSLLE